MEGCVIGSKPKMASKQSSGNRKEPLPVFELVMIHRDLDTDTSVDKSDQGSGNPNEVARSTI